MTTHLFAAVFAAWTWTRPAAPRAPAWPSGMPVFAAAEQVNFASELGNGTRLVNLVTATPAPDVLAAARQAYMAAGWTESPIRARDMRIFTRGPSVAAVLAETLPHGTRVTAIQRPRGL